MAVLLETSKGDIVVDLYAEDAPLACKNFLKLCKYGECLKATLPTWSTTVRRLKFTILVLWIDMKLF